MNSTLAEYAANLFPRMNDSAIQQVVALYSNLTDVSAVTVPEQAAFVMGDSIFVCPAFYMLDAFPDNSGWKVRERVLEPPCLTHSCRVSLLSLQVPTVANWHICGLSECFIINRICCFSITRTAPRKAPHRSTTAHSSRRSRARSSQRLSL